jgi:hypothetical protein
LTAIAPKIRATSITIATAMKNAATRRPKASRCFVAVNRSPDGLRPEGVETSGLPLGSSLPVGSAASSGIS